MADYSDVENELTNADYFAHRAAKARALSETATDPRAAEAHREMALRYEQLAAEFSTDPATLRVDFGQRNAATV